MWRGRSATALLTQSGLLRKTYSGLPSCLARQSVTGIGPDDCKCNSGYSHNAGNDAIANVGNFLFFPDVSASISLPREATYTMV